uniref:Ig-like domain-containing protein n=1 Tax=Mola mola TaxID=94237 RepID=A0A3Q4BN57_MOLML
ISIDQSYFFSISDPPGCPTRVTPLKNYPVVWSQGAPTMELQAQDIVVIEGEKLHLNIPYRAIPTPKVVWQKDTVECKVYDRISMTLRPYLLLLQRNQTHPFRWRLMIQLPSPSQSPGGLQTTMALPAVVTGRPQPEVKWAKDESEIDKERVIVDTEGKNSTLFIKKAMRGDHGKYQISGTNSSGTKTAETKVDVMGQC